MNNEVNVNLTDDEGRIKVYITYQDKSVMFSVNPKKLASNDYGQHAKTRKHLPRQVLASTRNRQ